MSSSAAMVGGANSPDLPVQFNVIDKIRPHTGDEHPISWFSAITTYFGYAILVLFGHIRDFFGRFTGASRYFGSNMRAPKVWWPAPPAALCIKDGGTSMTHSS